MENAFIRRHWGWAGFGMNDTRITLRGNVIVSLSQKKKPFWRYNLPEKQIFFSSYHMSDKTLEHYLNKIIEISPKAIQGYPSAIYTLAKYMFENDIIIPVDIIFTSSEPLYDIQKDVIEKQFQSKIYDLYGLSERTIAAGQCSEGNYHIFSEYGIVELSKDNEVISDNEFGEIIATGLNNYGMPLIRYKTGDITRLKDESCECGRHLTLMEPIRTRLRDMIVTGDGLILPPSTLSLAFKNQMNIEKSQIVQESRNKLNIKIIKRPGYSEKDTNLLLNELRSIVGANTNIEFEFINDIPLTKAGKYRWIISKISPDFKLD
jgi:phenylacetate-CoA ligase